MNKMVQSYLWVKGRARGGRDMGMGYAFSFRCQRPAERLYPTLIQPLQRGGIELLNDLKGLDVGFNAMATHGNPVISRKHTRKD
jgi:hypothetical protein